MERQTRRIMINVAFFALVGLSLTVWAFTNVIHLDRIERPYFVTAHFKTSPGLSPRFEVTYQGQKIGAIKSVTLEKGEVAVVLKIDQDQDDIPGVVDATVRRKSAVGEPYVDLQPREGVDPAAGDRLQNGDVIEVEHTFTPLSYQELFATLDTLIAAVDADDLGTLVHELAVGLDGRTDTFRTLLAGADQITTDLAANAELLDAVIADLHLTASTLADHSGSLVKGIDNVAALAETLRASQADTRALLARAPAFGELVASVVEPAAGSVGCVIDSLGTVASRLDAATLAKVSHLLGLSPQFLATLQGLRDPSGFARGTVLGAAGAPPPVYAAPLSPPTPPNRAPCPTGPRAIVPPGAVDVADAGGVPDDTVAGRRPVGVATDDAAESRGPATTSPIGTSDTDLISSLLEPLLLLLLLAAIAFGGVRALAAWRRRQADDEADRVLVAAGVSVAGSGDGHNGGDDRADG